jgi:beta-glucosidase/6-phospho-beta-glucosidase/beta-galactosidase
MTAQAGQTERSLANADYQRTRRPFIGAFESTYLPGHGIDVADSTGHSRRWRHDIDALTASGVTRARYPIRWHRVEAEPGHFDWSETDAQLEHLRERGISPIIDLVHHTSYPEWLDDGFRDARFAGAYLRYAEAFARRYPWVPAYTLFNEPFATLFLAGHEALWPPYDRGLDGFVRLVNNVLPAVAEAHQLYRSLLPDAQHVWVDTCEHHAGTPGAGSEYAVLANDRRHALLDLVLQKDLNSPRAFMTPFLASGADRLIGLPVVTVDLLGLDYYCHSEWWYDEAGGRSPSPHPLGFAAVAEQYSNRYGFPMLLSETNIRGQATDRASWLRYTLEQYELAESRGVRLEGYCWFPHVDSCDWDSLLARPAGRIDPVGVVSLGRGGERQRTLFTQAWEAALAGVPTTALPAYRFQAPCRDQLAGLLPQLSHWNWRDPPPAGVVEPMRIDLDEGVDEDAEDVA